MESLARLVALMALTATAVGATAGGTAAHALAKNSKHRTAITVGGALAGAVAGWAGLVALGRMQSQ